MSGMTRAQALKAMALSASDPNLRRAALEAASKAENNSAALLEVKQARDAVLQFLLGLPADKAAPSAASIGEVLDLPAKQVQAGLDSLTRDGRLLSDGTLDPRVRANQKPGGASLRQQQASDAANARAAEAGTAEGHRVTSQGNQSGKLVNPRGLHGKALVSAISDAQSGRATLTKRERDQIAGMNRQIAELTATIKKIQGNNQ